MFFKENLLSTLLFVKFLINEVHKKVNSVNNVASTRKEHFFKKCLTLERSSFCIIPRGTMRDFKSIKCDSSIHK